MATPSSALVKCGVVIMLALVTSACNGASSGGQTAQSAGNSGCDLTGSRIASARNCTDTSVVKASVNTGSGTSLAGNNAAGVGGQVGAASSGH